MSTSPSSTAAAAAGRLQLCTFRLADQLFGVDILEVKEINRAVDFTPIYHAPREVRGYVNIRGQIRLVLDLRMMLGLPARPLDARSRVVIFKDDVGESFGVLVDDIGDIVKVDESQLEERRNHEEGPGTPGTHPLIWGEAKLDGTLLVLLNARRLLPTIAPAA